MKTSFKIDAILDDITRLVAAAFKIDHVSILTLDDQKKNLRIRSMIGTSKEKHLVDNQKFRQDITHWITNPKKPLIFQDMLGLNSTNNKSFISLPLRVDNELLGVINFNSNKPFDEYTDQEFERLVMFSDRIALLIESIELILQAEKKIQSISVIKDISQDLVFNHQDVPGLFSGIISHVKTLVQANRVSLLSVDNRNQTLQYQMVSGKRKFSRRTFTPANGFLAKFHDPGQLVTFQQDQLKEIFVGKNIIPPLKDSYISFFPIFVEKHLWGLFEIWKKKWSASINTIDLELLKLISALTGVGIHQQQLYEQIHQMNQRLKEQVDVAREDLHASSEQIEGLKNFQETVLQNIGSGILTVDCNGIITSINKSGTDILGYKKEELIGKKLSDVFGESRAEYLLFDSFHKDSPYFKKEINIFRKDDREIPLGFTTSCMEVKGKGIVGAIILFRDLSEVKHMHAEIRRMDRLVTLGELASGIAHELKNPLAVIGFSLDCLKNEDTDPKDKEEFFDAIERNVKRMDSIIKKLLSMGRQQSKPKYKQQQINKVIESTIMFIKKKCSQNKIELEKKLAKNLPPIMIDENQIQQVFLNIALNSIEAMHDGGSLQFVSKKIVGKSLDKSPCIQVEITDTGTGIPEVIKEQVFDAFFTTKNEGTGLGLAISKRIIADHEGSIGFQSHENGGTTCIITIPIQQQD